MEFGELRLAWLEAFVKAVAEGKRWRAAEQMGVLPSDVTRYIDHLEEWTGTILLMPNAAARPTLEGVEFLAIAEEIVEKLEAFQETRRVRHQAAPASMETDKASAPAKLPKPPKRSTP